MAGNGLCSGAGCGAADASVDGGVTRAQVHDRAHHVRKNCAQRSFASVVRTVHRSKGASVRIKFISLAAASLLATACQTWGPTWSEVSGDRYSVADPNRRPAILLRVGDESVGFTKPYKVAPGTYRVEVQAPPHHRFSGSA